MKIARMIEEKRASLSFEFFPPREKVGEDKLFENIAKLESLHPTFVSVTYGAGGSTMKNTRQVVKRIMRETALTPMPHLTCIDQSKDELNVILEDYKDLGIENILALRGDPPAGAKKFVPPLNGLCYARELVSLASSFYTFSIGVAVYPEGHCESPSLELDITYTKEKIEAGADFAITQMFFDNTYFYSFLERTIRAGIRIPIIPGIAPITDFGKVKTFAAKCGATIPDSVMRRFEEIALDPAEVKKVGIELATRQCSDLLTHGVPYLHFYTFNRIEPILEIVNNLSLQAREPGQPVT
jgi:methylenetetrahydrofolate reductase (NADPH)